MSWSAEPQLVGTVHIPMAGKTARARSGGEPPVVCWVDHPGRRTATRGGGRVEVATRGCTASAARLLKSGIKLSLEPKVNEQL